MLKGIFFLLLLVGCASKPKPNEYQANADKAEPSKGAVPLIMSNEVVSGIILSGIGLASDPDYYRNKTLSGKCVLLPNTKDVILDVPCKENVEVTLLSDNGKELAKTSLLKGEFAFSVKRNEQYGLKVTVPKGYKMASGALKNLVMGDQVMIKLRRTKNG